MLFRRFCFNLKRKCQFVCFSSHYLNKFRMNNTKTAYFQLLEGADKFKVFFHFTDNVVGVNRQFNFERTTVESLQNFITRVSTNLERAISSKINKKLKKGTLAENSDFKVTIGVLTSDNVEVAKEDTCKDIFFSNKYEPGSLKLRMMGQDFNVAINSPWIDSVSFPSSIMVGFPVYPIVDAKFTDIKLSSFVWMKSSTDEIELHSSSKTGPSRDVKKRPEQWSVVGNDFLYTPIVADIGSKLRIECIPKNSSSTGPPYYHDSTNIIEAGPGICPFQYRHLFTENKTTENSFRVISYNILADVYSSTDTAKNELFNYCPTYALDIDYRKQLFLKELLGYNADLICLQEVDKKVFDNDLVPVLEQQELQGILATKFNKNEGVSTFYSSSKFKLLEFKEIILSEELLQKPYCSHILDSVKRIPQLEERLNKLGTTALIVVLESLEKPGELLVVANTHLYFYPDADHIRLLQAGIIMAFLNDYTDSLKIKHADKALSIVFCGDLNSVPECGIYKLMTTKHVPEDLIDWRSKPEEAVLGLSLSQPFNIDSACGTPEYTNYTVSFAACLDYIYYQTDRLVVDSIVPMPSGDELREHRAIPSVVFPSDHVALVANLKWK